MTRSRAGTPPRSRATSADRQPRDYLIPRSRGASPPPQGEPWIRDTRRTAPHHRERVGLLDFHDLNSGLQNTFNRLSTSPYSKFTGSAHEDVDQWFEGYKVMGESRGWDEQIAKQMLTQYVDGMASSYLSARRLRPIKEPRPGVDPNHLRACEKNWADMTLREVQEDFCNWFRPMDLRKELRAKFHEEQKKNEDAVTYLSQKLDVGTRLGRSTREIIDVAKEGLLPELRKKFTAHYNPDLESFMAELKEVQRTLQALGELHPSSKRGPRKPPASPESGDRLSPVPRPRVCYNCGQSGHMSPDCRAPQYMRGSYRAARPNGPRYANRGGNRNYYPVGRQAQPVGTDNQSNLHNPAPRNDDVRPPNQVTNNYPARNDRGLQGPGGAQRVLRLDARHEPEYKLGLMVDGVWIEGLFDTGASATCLDYRYFRNNWPDTDLLAPEDLLVTGVGGNVQVKGIARLNLEYNDKYGESQSVVVSAVVIDQLGENFIIGRDFMNKINPTLKLGDNKIYCDRPLTEPKRLNQPPTLVYGREEVQVPAKSTTLLPVYVASSTRKAGVISNCENVRTNVAIANSIVELDEDKALVPVTNFGTENCVVKKGEVVAHFEDCDYSAEDFGEEKESSMVFKEKTREIQLPRGKVPVGSLLNDQQTEELIELLKRYDHLFSFNGELGDCNVMEHEIDTGDAKPKHSAPYRQSPMVREKVQKQIDEWLAAGVIRPSNSPWASPIVVVPKKDNTMRMCIDLRGVNKLTKRDVYPLPVLDDTLASLNGAIYFSSLDLNQGYMQIRMAQEDIAKTAFISHDGLYEFVRMPFGLTNAPATFQRCMNIILSGLTYNQCLVYLDDVIVFGDSFENHNRNLVNVLQRIENANLTIKPSKCAFAVDELRFLGHIVGGEGIRMDPNKVQAMLAIPPPTTVTEIKSFIGSASYYRRFIRDFSKIVSPMTQLTKKDEPFVWKESQQQAFDEIKKLLTTQPILCHYDPKVPMELRTDACGYGLGAILLHIFPDGSKRVISYASRLMNAAEKNYGISEQECLAVVWAIDKFKHCLQGVHFKVVTDHLALTWLNNKTNLSGRLMRWALALQPYDFEVVYKSGQHHKDADLLSRNPTVEVMRITYGKRGSRQQGEIDQEAPSIEEEEVVRDAPPALTLQQIIDAQSQDLFCLKIQESVTDFPNFEVDNGLLIEVRNKEPTKRIVLPEALFNHAMYQAHDNPLSAHGGFRKTLWRFNQHYYLPRAAAKVKTYVKTCHLCQTKKDPWTKRIGLLQSIECAKRPFERIGIDTLGPFRKSANGNEKIIVVTDYMTKWSIARAVPRENAEVIADMLVQEVYLKFGAPEVIISDRGKSFNTDLMKALYKEFDSKHISSTPYHPQTNGLVERFNRTLAVMLSMFVSDHHRNWDDFLQYVVFAYNTVAQDSTGYAPFYLLHGFQARMVTDVIHSDSEHSVTTRLETLHQARELAIEANKLAQKGQKRNYDKNRYVQEFKEGDLVLVHRARGYTGQTTKLRHPYEGPFRIIKKNSDLVYLVENLNRSKRIRRPPQELVHVARMKPYHERTQTTVTTNWLKSALQMVITIILFIQCAYGRVVWRKTNVRMITGTQDLYYLVHYLLPCSNGESIYNHTKGKRRLEVSKNFVKWCDVYTTDIMTKNMNLFCSDGGTSNENHPSTILRQFLLNKERNDEESRSEDTTTLPSRKLRKRRRKTKAPEWIVEATRGPSRKLVRRKRLVGWLVAIFVTSVVSLVGGYLLKGNTVRSSEVSSELENQLTVQNENNKKLAESIEEVNRRVDDAFKYLNMTMVDVKDLKDKVAALQVEANVNNQATVATIVSRFERLAQNLQQIAKAWQLGKIHESFFEVFKLDKNCGYETAEQGEACPVDLYKAISCQYDAGKQDIRFKLSRQVIDTSVEIIEADPFSYVHIKMDNMTEENFWRSSSLRPNITLCELTYAGITHLALSKGCLKRISPERPRETDIPIISEKCLTEKEKKKVLRYTKACRNTSLAEFDLASVKMKIESDKLLVYCAYHQYQLENGTQTDCPNEVISLPIRANVTIWRSKYRYDPTPLMRYKYGMIKANSTTSLGVPENIKIYYPDDTLEVETIDEARKNMTNAMHESQKKKVNLKTRLLRYIKREGSLSGRILNVIAFMAIIGIPVLIGMFIANRLNKTNKKQVRIQQDPEYRYYTQDDSQDDEIPESPVRRIAFYDSNRTYAKNY